MELGTSTLGFQNGGRGFDEQRFPFVTAQALCPVQRDITHLCTLYVLGPTGAQLSLVLLWAASAAFSAQQFLFFPTKGCRRVVLPTPQSSQHKHKLQLSLLRVCSDVDRTSLCTGLRVWPSKEHPAMKFVLSGFIPISVIIPICFWGHHPSDSSDIRDKNNPAYTIIKSTFLQLGNV